MQIRKGDVVTDTNLKPIEFNKLMAFFLEKQGINKKFRSCNYGYRTYDNSWKLFKERLQIVHHKNVKSFMHGEYVNMLEETVFSIIQSAKSVKVSLVYKKLI